MSVCVFRPEDAGVYTCVAENKAGTTSVELRLTVQGRLGIVCH